MNVPDQEDDGYRRYGQWAGEPRGHKEDKTRCAYEVFPSIGMHHQCTRKRGYGSAGEFCKTHAKLVDHQTMNDSLALGEAV